MTHFIIKIYTFKLYWSNKRTTLVKFMTYQSKILDGIQYIEFSGHHSQNSKVCIFLPGLGAFKENYIHLAEYFRSFYEQIFILDLPQQGSTGKWRIGTICDHLKFFIEKKVNSNTEITLAGHSAGAYSILYFMLGYSGKLENYLIEHASAHNTDKTLADGEAQLPSTLSEDFSRRLEYINHLKVNRILLYAPPDQLRQALPYILLSKLYPLKNKTVGTLLNILVNYPQAFLNLFHSGYIKFNFSAVSNRNHHIRFLGLKVEDHKTLLDYLTQVPDISQYINFLESILQNEKKAPDNTLYQVIRLTRNKISSIKKQLHYGTTDWIVRSFPNRESSYTHTFKYYDPIQIIRHKGLGHKLSKRYSVDFNLNLQFINNKDVMHQSLSFIKESEL